MRRDLSAGVLRSRRVIADVVPPLRWSEGLGPPWRPMLGEVTRLDGVHAMHVIHRRVLVRQWAVVFAIASSALVLQAQPVAAVACGGPKHVIVLSSGTASPGS